MDILRHLLIGVHHSLSNEELEPIALDTHGFVVADLAALCNEAALIALCRFISLRENSSLQLGHPDSSVDKFVWDTGHPLGYHESSLSLSFSTMSLDDCPSANSEKDEKILLVNNDDFQKAEMKIRPSANAWGIASSIHLQGFNSGTVGFLLYYSSSIYMHLTCVKVMPIVNHTLHR